MGIEFLEPTGRHRLAGTDEIRAKNELSRSVWSLRLLHLFRSVLRCVALRWLRILATTMAPPISNWPAGALISGATTSPLGSNVSATPPSGDTSEESGDDSNSIAQVRSISPFTSTCRSFSMLLPNFTQLYPFLPSLTEFDRV